MKRIASLLFLLSSVAYGQIALISHTSANMVVNSTSPVFSTAGASVILVAAMMDSNPVKPSDTCGNVYTLVSQAEPPGYAGVDIYAAFGIAATCTSDSVTVGPTQTGGNSFFFEVAAFSGAAGIDQVVTTGTQSSSTPYSLSITPKAGGELVFGVGSGTFLDAGVTALSGLTILDNVNSVPLSNGNNYETDGYLIQSSAVPSTASWSTQIAGATFGGIIVSLYSTQAPATLQSTVTALPEAFVGTAYSYQLTATGGVLPYTWTGTGTLPLGVALVNGALTGTPTATGTSTLGFTVTDAQGHTATTPSLTLTVASAPPIISTTGCPAGTQYAPYAGCTIQATGGTLPITYSWCGNGLWTGRNGPGCPQSLPEGLSINSTTGAVSGTMLGMGQYVVEFTATDAAGAVATQLIDIEVAGSNSLGTCSWPADSVYYLNVANLPVDTSPLAPIYPAYINSPIVAGFGDITFGIPFMVVPASQPMVPMASAYASALTQAPFPFNAPMEGTRNAVPNPPPSSTNGVYLSDNHVLVQQLAGPNNTCGEWDTYQVYPNMPDNGNHGWGDGLQDGGFGQWSAHWDMSGYALLPDDQGGVDAAGLPMIPYLENADEVIGTGTPSAPNGVIHEAKRFTLEHTANAHVWPATAQAGQNPSCTGGYVDPNGGGLFSQSNPPTSCTGVTGPMGEIYRLKANVPNPACVATSPQSAIIIQGFRNYGIIDADNGESGAVIGTNDSRWNNADLACLNSLNLSMFEPVNVQASAVNWPTSTQVTTASTTGTTTSGTAVVTVTDSTGATTQKSFPYTLTTPSGAATPVTVTSPTTLPAGAAGTPYSYALLAAQGTAPYTWTISSGALPPGLFLTTGTISGTPSAAGTFAFGVTVTDSTGVTASGSLSITISPAALQIVTATIPNFTAGQVYSAQISAIGGIGTLVFSATGLPPGVVISASGVLSGTPQ
jgi:large repetitive protein